MWSEEVKNRTFGFELEFADADKTLIELPKGYSYTDNDLARMHNSDGSPVTHTGRYGGEINTRPYRHTKEDLEELKNFIHQIRDAGGYLIWNEGFDAHFYIKDLPLETIKRLFELSYWVAPYLKKIWDLAEWFENKYISPSPEWSYVEKMNRVQSIEEIPQVFANSSHRGHIRFYLNFVPISKIGTMEFRLFNASWEWEKVYESIKSMYSYVDYAVKNTDTSKYKEIDSIEKCIEVFGINPDNVPRKHNPLLWAGEHNNFMSLVGEPFSKNRAMMGKIYESCKPFGTVHIVNSFNADIEQVLTNERIVVYTKSLFMYYFYSIILKDERFSLAEPFGWLKMEEGTKAERIAKLFLFQDIKKSNNDDFYHQSIWSDYKNNFDKYVTKYKGTAEKIVSRLENKNIEVVIGDVLDAIKVSDDDSILVYQSEFSVKRKSVDNALAYLTETEPIRISTPYSKVNLENINYLVITMNAYMGLPKLFRQDRKFIYSNLIDRVKPVNMYSGRKLKPLPYKKLPDDHQITEKSEIKFIRASMGEVDYLRTMYLKKDILLGGSPFSYLWFIDDYLFGASMFDFTKQQSDTHSKAWMKSDFVIDSKQPKLSKLLIMAVLSKEFKEELDIKYKMNTDIIHTTVFTNNPVSMKYRGVFKLASRDEGKLHYEAEAGKYRNLKEVLKEFIRKR